MTSPDDSNTNAKNDSFKEFTDEDAQKVLEVLEYLTKIAAKKSASILYNITLQDLAYIGSFASGIGVIFGAISASLIIRRNEIRRQWIEAFRSLYREFWENDDIAVIRRCITNNREYENILKPVLERRNSSLQNNLYSDDNDIIEKVDRFCSALVRVKSIGQEKMNYAQEELWNKLLFGNFWADRAAGRYELRQYIVRHWPEVISPDWGDYIKIIWLKFIYNNDIAYHQYNKWKIKKYIKIFKKNDKK